MGKVVDLRTDADSEPPPEMRKAMAEAPTGLNLDLVGEDAATNQLEEKVAEMTGKEAGLFVPTGTMADLIAVLTYCDNRGDEVILGDQCHIVVAEAGGASGLAGAMVHTVPNDEWGMMDPKDVEAAIHPVLPTSSYSSLRTKLICIENTHVRCGGTVLTIEDQRQIAEVAHRHGVPVFCDGARFAHAAVYLGVNFAELAKDLDSVSFGFTKPLGVPTGYVLCGSADFIDGARRSRIGQGRA